MDAFLFSDSNIVHILPFSFHWILYIALCYPFNKIASSTKSCVQSISASPQFIALRYSLCFSRTPMVSLAPLFPLHLPQWSQTQSRLSALFFPCMTLCHVTQAPVAAAGHFRGRGCPLINNGFYDDFQRNIVFSMPVNRMDIVDTFAGLHPRRLQLLNFE